MNGSQIRQFFKGVLFGLGLIGFLVIIYFLPPIHEHSSWRVDFAVAYIRSILQPAGEMPTPAPLAVMPQTALPSPTLIRTATPLPSPTPVLSPVPTFTPTPIPGQVVLAAPKWEKQAPNNCGATTMSLYLHFFGWQGDQHTISDLIKPVQADRNVNVEELVYYVRTKAGWLNTEYRVGGSIDTLRRVLAAGIPVMVEESSRVEQQFARYDDDFWDGHYLLITGYDDIAKTFLSQDAFLGPNRKVSYSELDLHWQPFNRVFILVFLPEQKSAIQSILGDNWNVDQNRQNALQQAQAETISDPKNPFAWFNVGTNLVYFERYTEAAVAYDTARQLKIPQRMLRYQFGPFIAYFHSGRTDDLLALTAYALKITNNSEEALLWQGWGLYRLGKKDEAVDAFTRALKFHPGYEDAIYALNFVQNN